MCNLLLDKIKRRVGGGQRRLRRIWWQWSRLRALHRWLLPCRGARWRGQLLQWRFLWMLYRHGLHQRRTRQQRQEVDFLVSPMTMNPEWLMAGLPAAGPSRRHHHHHHVHPHIHGHHQRVSNGNTVRPQGSEEDQDDMVLGWANFLYFPAYHSEVPPLFDHACRTSYHHSANIRIQPTHQQSTYHHFSFVLETIRCAAIAPSQNDSFFFHNNQDTPFHTTTNPYSPTDTILHPYVFTHIPYPSIHHWCYAVCRHLTEVSNIK